MNALIPLEGQVDVSLYLMVLYGHLYPILNHFFLVVLRMAVSPSIELKQSKSLKFKEQDRYFSVFSRAFSVTRSEPGLAFMEYSRMLIMHFLLP